jgi:MFS family permease
VTTLGRRLTLCAILAAVAVAFADSSIVVLALPSLLQQFDTSVTAVAWVVTAYNLVLALASLTLVWLVRRVGAVLLVRAGCAVFLGASLVCGFSGSLWLLIVFRGVQGLGAALVLVGALPLVSALARTPAGGSATWVGATVFGAAVGPACGGALTQLFSWHAIFFAQAPLPALAFLATFARREVRLPSSESTAGVGRWRLLAVDAAVALESAALVGLLFIAVVMFIDVWRLSPLAAAGAVSVIPLATVAVQFLSPVAERKAVGVGIMLFTTGLAGMAFLPATSVPWAVVALGIGGAGLGLAVPRLGRVALAGHRDLARAAARATCVRHLGLVLGLLALTPLLAANLDTAADRAELEGVATVLEAPAPGKVKLQVALDLVPVLGRPPQDGIPSFAQELAPRHQPELTAVGRQLDSVVEATVTRAFRGSFLLAGLFALLGLPFVGLAVARREGSRHRCPIALVLLPIGIAAFIGAEIASGALDYGQKPKLLAPCVSRSVPGGFAQRQLLVGLDALACRLHTTREQLIVRVSSTPLAGSLASYIENPNKLPSWLRAVGGLLHLP